MKTNPLARKLVSGAIGLLGVALFTAYHSAQAQRDPPTEHKGVGVSNLGVIQESSLTSQIGLSGYIMQLREITLEPGGQIAKHDHAKRPGLVWTLSGSWIEGRASGQKEYPASMKKALLEDENTEHWFWNDGPEPVTVVVCDIIPAK